MDCCSCLPSLYLQRDDSQAVGLSHAMILHDSIYQVIISLSSVRQLQHDILIFIWTLRMKIELARIFTESSVTFYPLPLKPISSLVLTPVPWPFHLSIFPLPSTLTFTSVHLLSHLLTSFHFFSFFFYLLLQFFTLLSFWMDLLSKTLNKLSYTEENQAQQSRHWEVLTWSACGRPYRQGELSSSRDEIATGEKCRVPFPDDWDLRYVRVDA